MKKTLLALFTLVALAIGIQTSFAACPCSKHCDPCVKPAPCGCACAMTPCAEDWLCPQSIEDYFCRIGLNECQKDEARNAIVKFECATQSMRENGCKCENKCECRAYRKALRDLDCKMKLIVTKCQKSDYLAVRQEIKDKVKCAHKCLISPFHKCKCACKG